MLIVSHHLLKMAKVEFPLEHIVMRINLAWMKSKEEMLETLRNIKHDIYLDYPQGRSKPPRPIITLDEAVDAIPKFRNIKYFAVSNVEDPVSITAIKSCIPEHVEIIPKIETRAGIESLEKIIDSIAAKHIMLDKEDIYTNVNHDHELFVELVRMAREKCKMKNVKVLELQGVVFAPHDGD